MVWRNACRMCAFVLVALMLVVPFTTMAATLTGTVNDSAGSTIGQANIEIYRFFNVDTSYNAMAIQSALLTQTLKTINLPGITVVKPNGVRESTEIYSNSKEMLGVGPTANSADTSSTTLPISGAPNINPNSDDSTGSTQPSGAPSTATRTSSSTDIRPAPPGAVTVTPQTDDLTEFMGNPGGHPRNAYNPNPQYASSSVSGKPSGAASSSYNYDAASSTTSQPTGAQGVTAQSRVGDSGTFLVDTDGDGILEIVWYQLVSGNGDGDYNDPGDYIRLSADDSTFGEGFLNNGICYDPTTPNDDEDIFRGIGGGGSVLIGASSSQRYSYHILFGGSVGSGWASIWARWWFVGSIGINVDDADSTTELLRYVLTDSNSDGIYDTVDISLKDYDYWDGNTANNQIGWNSNFGNSIDDERYQPADPVGAPVSQHWIYDSDTQYSHQYNVWFNYNPYPSGNDFGVQALSWHTGTFSVDVDADGTTDTVYFALGDTDSDGIYETCEFSVDDAIYGETLFVDNYCGPNEDERDGALAEWIRLQTYMFIHQEPSGGATGFDTTPSCRGDNVMMITARSWYEGSLYFDLDRDGVDDDILYFSIADRNSDGLYDILDLSGFDNDYNEGATWDNTISNNNDECDTWFAYSGTIATDLQDVRMYANDFYIQFVINPGNGAVSPDIWFHANYYAGTFTNIDTDGNGGATDTIRFVISDTDSDGIAETIEWTTDDSIYGETLAVDDYTGTDEDERDVGAEGSWILSASDYVRFNSYRYYTTHTYYPGWGWNDAWISNVEWFTGTLTIDTDGNLGTGLETLYYVMTDTDSNGLYDTVDLSTDDALFYEDSSLAWNGATDTPGYGNDDERITSDSYIRFGTYLFYVDFDKNPAWDADDIRITAQEFYTGTESIDVDGDGILDTIYYLLSDTDSNGAYETLDISTDDNVFGEGSLNDGTTRNNDDERLTTSGTLVYLGVYRFYMTYVGDPPTYTDDVSATARSVYHNSFIIDVDGDGQATDYVYYFIYDRNSNGLYDDVMELTTDDTVTGEGNVNDGQTGLNNDEEISGGGLVVLDTYMYYVDFEKNPYGSVKDAYIRNNEWHTGTATIEGMNINAVAADDNSDGVYDVVYLDLTKDGNYGNYDDAVAIGAGETFSSSVLMLTYRVLSVMYDGTSVNIEPYGASMGNTPDWYVGYINVNGVNYPCAVSDSDNDGTYDTADFDTNRNGVMDDTGNVEAAGHFVYLSGQYYQIFDINNAGTSVKIIPYSKAIISPVNDISQSGKYYYGVLSEQVCGYNINGDGDMYDSFDVLVLDNTLPGVYDTIFIDTDDDSILWDETPYTVGSSIVIGSNSYILDFVSSSGDGIGLRQTNDMVTSTTSDEYGRYTITVGKDGYYWAKVYSSNPSWGYTTLYETNGGKGIYISGSTTMSMTLTDSGNTISGMVTDQGGNALSDVIIDVYDSMNRLVATTTTKAMGAYSIVVAPASGYDLVFRKIGYLTDDGRSGGTVSNVDVSAGNSAGNNVQLTKDTTPPTVKITTPYEGQFVSGVWSVNATVSDANTIDSVKVSFDYGLTWHDMISVGGGKYTYQWDTQIVEDGNYRVTVKATDNATLTTTVYVNVIVGNDKVPPECTIISPKSGEYIYGLYTIKIFAKDNKKVWNVSIKIDGKQWIGISKNAFTGYYEYTIDTRQMTDGIHTLDARVYDAANNSNTTSISFKIDNNAPVLTVNSPRDGEYVKGLIRINVSATDRFLNKTEYNVDDSGWVLIPTIWDTTKVNDGVHTVRIRAVDNASHITEITVNVIVDNNAPLCSVHWPPSGKYLEGTVKIRVRAEDIVGVKNVTLSIYNETGTEIIKSRMNKDTEYIYTYILDTTLLPDGNYTLNVSAVDGIGHITNSTSVKVHVDNNAPVLSVVSPISGEIVEGSVSIRVSVKDKFLERVEYNIDGAGWMDISMSWDTTTVIDGEHTIYIRAVDKAGHETSTAVVVTVDNNAPVCALNYPSMYQYVEGEITIMASASDDVGIKNVTINIYNRTVGYNRTIDLKYNILTHYYEAVIDTTVMRDAVYFAKVRAVDYLNHTTNTSVVVFAVDNNEPYLEVISPGNGDYVEGDVTINVTVKDEFLVGVLYRIDGGKWVNIDDIWDTSECIDGMHMIEVIAVDASGKYTIVSIEVIVDNNAPYLEIRKPLHGDYTEGEMSVEVVSSDKVGIESVILEIENESMLMTENDGVYTVSIDTSAYSDGVYDIKITSTDLAGHSVSTTVSVNIDNNAPEMNIISPKEGFVSGEIELKADFSDVFLEKVEYMIDDGVWNELDDDGKTFNTTSLSDGKHTVYFRAMDKAGHITMDFVEITVDNNAPICEFTMPSNIAGRYVLKVIAIDDVGVKSVKLKITEDSTPVEMVYSDGYYVYSIDTLEMLDGTYTLNVTVVDMYGWRTTVKLTYTVDNDVPTVDVRIKDRSIVEGSIDVSVYVSAEDVFLDIVAYSVDGGPWSNISEYLDTSEYSDGEHTLYIKATDSHGNEVIKTVRIIIDNNAPEVLVIKPTADGTVVSGIMKLDVSAFDYVNVNEVRYRVDSGDWKKMMYDSNEGIYTVCIDTKLECSDGEHRVEIVAYDALGHNTSAVRMFVVDNSAPTFEKLNKEPLEETAVIKVMVKDEITSVEKVHIRIDGKEWMEMIKAENDVYKYIWHTTVDDNGEHTIEVKAVDSMGNEGRYTYRLTVDNFNWMWVVLAVIIALICVMVGTIAYMKKKGKKEESEIYTPSQATPVPAVVDDEKIKEETLPTGPEEATNEKIDEMRVGTLSDKGADVESTAEDTEASISKRKREKSILSEIIKEEEEAPALETKESEWESQPEDSEIQR